LIINTRNKKHAHLAAVLISCLTEFNVENNLIAFTCKVDDFPKQNKNKKMNCKQIYIKDKQITYVHWQNKHKEEENGGEL
jgi:hypothetical protein